MAKKDKFRCGYCNCKVRVDVDATGMFVRPRGDAYALTTIADVVAFACGDTCAQAFADGLADAQEMKPSTMNRMDASEFAPSLAQVAREASSVDAKDLFIHLDDTLKLPREVTHDIGTGWCGIRYNAGGRWELIGPQEVRRLRGLKMGERVERLPVKPEGVPLLPPERFELSDVVDFNRRKEEALAEWNAAHPEEAKKLERCPWQRTTGDRERCTRNVHIDDAHVDEHGIGGSNWVCSEWDRSPGYPERHNRIGGPCS